jgi:hypothetical protein
MADGQPIVIGQNNSGQTQTTLQTNASGAFPSALKVLNALGIPAPNAIFGECQEGVGVRGMTGVNLPSTPSVTQAGVLGTGFDGVGVVGVSVSEAGVRGDADEGVGVQGSSRTSQGVEGRSTQGVGVEGRSTQGIGVRGESDGSFTGLPSSGSAVSGENMVGSGNGVTGLSGARNGVEGRSFSSAASGVYGQNDVGGFGVAGRANGDQPALLGENSGTGNGLTASSQQRNGVEASSQQRNGVEGRSSAQAASGVYGENLSRGGFGVAGRSNASERDPGSGGWGAGVLGDNTAGGWAGFFNGDIRVDGSIFKSGSNNFQIDHPVEPAHSYLNHFGVESSVMMNVYDGRVTTDGDGRAVVELPGYFEALNTDFRYQLTVIGDFAQAIVSEEITDNRFAIRTDRPNVHVSWQVTGIRHDAWATAHRTPAEMAKPEACRGKYLAPREHGQPMSAGIYYIQHVGDR